MPERTFVQAFTWYDEGLGRPRRYRAGVPHLVSDECAAFADENKMTRIDENKMLGPAPENKKRARPRGSRKDGKKRPAGHENR